MRGASKTFIIIGMVIDIISYIASIISSFAYGIWWLAILFIALFVIMIVVASKAVHTLDAGEKSIGLGVASLIFVSLLGGIFYLCWDGQGEYHYTQNTSSYSRNTTSTIGIRKYNVNDRVILTTKTGDTTKRIHCKVIEYNDLTKTYKVRSEAGALYSTSSLNLSIDTTPVVEGLPAQEMNGEEEKVDATIDKLKKLKELHDSNILTDEEYEEKRKKYLDQI